jgi:GT2 family glycosyltransferase
LTPLTATMPESYYSAQRFSSLQEWYFYEKIVPVTSMQASNDPIEAGRPVAELLVPSSAQTDKASGLDLSVIIVNYNVKDFLLQCLRSLGKAINNIKSEIIVIDNHSSDGSVNFLQPLFPGVAFVSLGENLGFARANNIGIQKAKGEFILFLNPDTLLEERTLEVMLRHMRENPQVGMSGCRILNPDGTLQLACRRSFPSPWAAFCKAFGLQKLFPRSRIFAQYNQTYRSDDEPHYVDAISGSFMFVRRKTLEQTGGFDPQFFMFGEDLDLCFRIAQAGWKISYTPQTSLIHFKGESTKRSSIDRVKVFYKAMELYAQKHHGRSSLLLLAVRLGIFVRSALAYANRYKRAILVMALDAISINGALLLATKLRFGEYFGFPPYAYPTVFIALTAVALGSLLAAGEYVDSKPSFRRAFAGLMLCFFVLSSLTSFFRDYAFSRGVLLMVISFSILMTGLVRILIAIYDQSVGKEADRRIAILGMNEHAVRIIHSLQSAETRNADLVGVIASSETDLNEFQGLPVIGNISYLSKLTEQYRLQEIIITDDSMRRTEMMELITNASALSPRFHVAVDYEDIVVSRIINEVAGIELKLPRYNIMRLRYRIFKRALDLLSSIFLLTLGIPFVYILAEDFRKVFPQIWGVFVGRYSTIGLYTVDDSPPHMGKIGLTGLAHISKPARLSPQVIRELNEYYLRYYTLSLDFDILIKDLIRRTNLP